jgi:hypothetical protein
VDQLDDLAEADGPGRSLQAVREAEDGVDELLVLRVPFELEERLLDALEQVLHFLKEVSFNLYFKVIHAEVPGRERPGSFFEPSPL